MSTGFEPRTPVAAKEHRCEWCVEPIAKGEKYLRVNGIYDGDFFSSAWHPECEEAFYKDRAARGAFWDDPICDGGHQRGKNCEESRCANW